MLLSCQRACARGGPHKDCKAAHLRDHAARDDAAVHVGRVERRLERGAADVVEIDVEAVWRVRRERLGRRRRLVVPGGVEAEVEEQLDLLIVLELFFGGLGGG